MTGISPSRALLSLRLAHLKIGIHGCANCQSLLCLKSAVGIQAVYNELLHCVWATGLFVQLDNQAGSGLHIYIIISKQYVCPNTRLILNTFKAHILS